MQIAGLSFSVLTNFGIFPESCLRMSGVGLSVINQGVKPPLLGAASLSIITPYDRYPESNFKLSSVGLSIMNQEVKPPLVGAASLSIITPYDHYPESSFKLASVGLSVVSKPTMPFICTIGLSVIQRTKFSTVEVTDLKKGYSYTMTS